MELVWSISEVVETVGCRQTRIRLSWQLFEVMSDAARMHYISHVLIKSVVHVVMQIQLALSDYYSIVTEPDNWI